MENSKQLWHKNIRLKSYDYSQSGYYFVTVCTNNRNNMLCDIVMVDLCDSVVSSLSDTVVAGLCACPDVVLTNIGSQVKTSILNIPILYKGVSIDQYVIMPNHIHIIVALSQESRHGSLPLQDVIGRLKSFTTYKYNQLNKKNGLILWQRNFYEHVIRNEQALDEIREYIINNPLKWYEDKYYTG